MQVHRLGERVAVYLGTGVTTYLSPEVVYEIAEAMMRCAVDIEDQPDFSKSEFETFNIYT